MAAGLHKHIYRRPRRITPIIKSMKNIVENFLGELEQACRSRSLVRLVLSRPVTAGSARRVSARLVETAKGICLSIVHEEQPSHRTETLHVRAALQVLRQITGPVYHDAHLFTTTGTLQLRFSRKGKPRLTRKHTGNPPPSTRHDRNKEHLIAPDAPFLKALDIAGADGNIRASMQAKYRQICHFAQLTRKALGNLEPRNGKHLKVVDLGCGKGYLTFALHVLINDILNKPAQTNGVDRRTDMVEAANRAVQECAMSGIKFKCGKISAAPAKAADVLTALHACDTATDDAIAAGIKAQVPLILVAPCCHHELRGNIRPQGAAAGMLRHTILLERTAAVLSDAMRCLILESNGYQVQAVEFVDPEHTPRNTLIIATYFGDNPRMANACNELKELERLFGISKSPLS